MDPAPTTINEPARRTPVCHACDVCVLGGSTTGVFAALAAARLGMRVAIVEALGLFGGTATASMVCIWHSIYNTTHDRQIAAGLPLELLERLRRINAITELVPPDANRHYTFNPAEMAIELDRMIVEAGIRPFLHTRFVAPRLDDDGRITHAIIEDKTGRRAIAANFFIDCTGDGDLAHRAGFACYQQPHLQPPTACLLMQGLNELHQRAPGFSLQREAFNPAHPEALRPGFYWGAQLPNAQDITMIAGTRVHGANCADADELTQAELEGRRQIRALCDIARRYAPDEAGRKLTLVGIPARIGIRHSRQVHCLHQLTETEVLHGVRFDDAIANGSYRVDVHSDRGGGLIFRYLDGREIEVGPGVYQERRWAPADFTPASFYQIPYRALVPRGARNLLVAGRCMDADEGAFGAVRVMINCTQMGQAAGVAASLALEAGVTPDQVPAAKLRQTLSAQGAVII